ncbi:Homoserine dehydrogenase [hydrothermal vent metagenome]|uniref:Homoserine dehydrogenase n=1 Tax=hydrothermal vent metagenome TaxID=652676 RepID=A0A3B0X0I5_9ZZZZ
MQAVKIGLMGLGTVGGGTATVLLRNCEEIARRVGRNLDIVHVAARDIAEQTLLDASKVTLSEDASAVVNDPNVDIVVELIGGYSPAKELVLRAIENGKHVVTANKALIAMHGDEIFKAAAEKGVIVAYEAAVAGGIPIIKAIREGLTANKIEWLAGIINGTGNFILTEMRDKGRDFNDVLKEAQALGYAERDPTFDVEGIDAAHKLTILASIAFGIPLQFDKTFTEGISKVTREDVNYAEELGYRIKHLGIARKTEKGIEMRVHPTLIPEKRLIANVDGVMNAVLIKADALGPTFYYGAGAGAEPTASAVVADLIDVARAMDASLENRVPVLGFQANALQDTPVVTSDEFETSYYVRMLADDRPGVLAEVTRIFSDNEISIQAVIQKEVSKDQTRASLIMMTSLILEKNMSSALSQIEALDAIEGDVVKIRLEHLE